MAKYTGAVRFPDGKLMYFVYQGTVDIARAQLFATPDEAFAAWNGTEAAVNKCPNIGDVEPIEVMPYFMHGSDEVHFNSRANRTLLLITGSLSREEADRESMNDSPYW